MAPPSDRPPPLRALALGDVTLVVPTRYALSSRDWLALRKLVARLRRARAANDGRD